MREEEKKDRSMGAVGDEAVFQQALIQALARVEAQPPVFLIPPDISLPPALTRSLDQVGRAMGISWSAFRLAFNFL